MATCKAPTNAIKSQLDALSGKVATVNPQSHIARFVFGELKGGDAKHAFAMSVIRAAVKQALQGNCRDIPETVALCQGKAVKAKAYLAGFQAIAALVAPVTYKGKLADKANDKVREQIAVDTDKAVNAFEKDYLAVFAKAKADAKTAKDAKAATPAAPAAPAAPAGDGEGVAPVATVDAVVVDIATSVQAVAQALAAGLLESSELEAICTALAAHAPVWANLAAKMADDLAAPVAQAAPVALAA